MVAGRFFRCFVVKNRNFLSNSVVLHKKTAIFLLEIGQDSENREGWRAISPTVRYRVLQGVAGCLRDVVGTLAAGCRRMLQGVVECW